jgi:sporulation protein YlmC with PRC-barrel domain
VADVLLAFDLLDRQILDRDGEPIGNVDDLELAADDDGTLTVAALLVGQQVLGRRIGGWLGGLIENTARRLEPTPDQGPIRIPYDLVATVDSAVTLSVRRDQLTDPPLEVWLREHLIGRIPGASHES